MMNNAEKWAKKMVKRGDRWWTTNHHVEKLQVFEIKCNFAAFFENRGSCRGEKNTGRKWLLQDVEPSKSDDSGQMS